MEVIYIKPQNTNSVSVKESDNMQLLKPSLILGLDNRLSRDILVLTPNNYKLKQVETVFFFPNVLIDSHKLWCLRPNRLGEGNSQAHMLSQL